MLQVVGDEYQTESPAIYSFKYKQKDISIYCSAGFINFI